MMLDESVAELLLADRNDDSLTKGEVTVDNLQKDFPCSWMELVNRRRAVLKHDKVSNRRAFFYQIDMQTVKDLPFKSMESAIGANFSDTNNTFAELVKKLKKVLEKEDYGQRISSIQPAVLSPVGIATVKAFSKLCASESGKTIYTQTEFQTKDKLWDAYKRLFAEYLREENTKSLVAVSSDGEVDDISSDDEEKSTSAGESIEVPTSDSENEILN